MNVHTPERQQNETQQQYRERRAKSRAAVKAMTKGPTQTPAFNALDVSRFFLGQHTNPKRNRGGEPARDMGQHPKFALQRKRKQHKHPQRDAIGQVITLVGKEPRRVWLAGISAQRGY